MELDINREVYEILSRRAAENGFASVEEYSIEILKAAAQELETQADRQQVKAVSNDKAVTNRLEDLGYLE